VRCAGILRNATTGVALGIEGNPPLKAAAKPAVFGGEFPDNLRCGANFPIPDD